VIVFYYAVNSRLGPQRVIPNVLEAVADAHQEEIELAVGEAA
jgi:hypothetical protein